MKTLIASTLILAATAAQAGHPLLSEDAGVLERGSCEVEAVAASAGGGAREHALGLACGLGHDAQWSLAAARARAGGATAKGLALGGKLGLWKQGDAALVLAPTLVWDDDGTGWRSAALDLNLVYSRPLAEDWTLHANLGHARDRRADQSATGWSLALEHAGVEAAGLTWAPMADLAGDDHGAPFWNLGLRVTLAADKAWLGLSYARQLDAGRARLATLGLKIAF